MKRHLKRLATPSNWDIKRKGIKYIAKPLPGPHALDRGLPLVVVLRDILHYAKTAREVRNILYHEEVLVDGVRRKHWKFMAGLMDIVSIPKLDEHFLVIPDVKNKFSLINVSKPVSKLCKVQNKSMFKGKIQLNLHDGKNVLVDKSDIDVGDTLVIELGTQKILDTVKFSKGSVGFLVTGKHAGIVGSVESIDGKRVILKGEDNVVFEAPKSYVFIIGKDKPLIPLK